MQSSQNLKLPKGPFAKCTFSTIDKDTIKAAFSRTVCEAAEAPPIFKVQLRRKAQRISAAALRTAHEALGHRVRQSNTTTTVNLLSKRASRLPAQFPSLFFREVTAAIKLLETGTALRISINRFFCRKASQKK